MVDLPLQGGTLQAEAEETQEAEEEAEEEVEEEEQVREQAQEEEEVLSYWELSLETSLETAWMLTVF